MATGRAWEESGEKRWRTGFEVSVKRDKTSQAWAGERREREWRRRRVAVASGW